MKKLLFMLFLVFLLSCEKYETACYECTGNSVASAPGFMTKTKKIDITICDLTKDDALMYWKSQNYTIIDVQDSVIVTVKQTVVCAKLTCVK